MKEEQNQVIIKIVKQFGHFLDRFIIMLVTMIVLVGIYALWDSYQIYQSASAEQYEIYRPSENNSVSFEGIQKVNPDVFAWITEYGTGIDYPIVHGEDNFQYLNQNAQKKYSLSGAIFMDYRNQPDFQDSLSILYGHHMAHHAMFGDIDLFKEEAFLNEHRYGSLFYHGNLYGLENFAYIETDAYDEDVYQTDIAPEQLGTYLELLRQKAIIYTPIELQAGEKIVLLSTCATGYTNARQIVAAKISNTVKENPYVTKGLHKEKTLINTTQVNEWHQAPLFIVLLTVVLATFVILRQMIKIMKNKKNR